MWNQWAHQRNLLASLSDSSKVRMSPSLTGPLTFLIMNRFWSSRNLTLTWVTWPLDPVRPITFTTTACFTWDSILCTGKKYYQLKKKKKNSHKSRHENIQTSMQNIDKKIVLRIWGFNLLRKHKPIPITSLQSNTIWTTANNYV